jgi:RNA polymerase sigma factor (sigma-70 family)
MDDDDSSLLKQFIATRDEAAFAGLVRRYVDLVYSAARRQTHDAAAAEDVTQQVFVLLAEKARSIREGEALAGWLLVTTRYVALNSFRSEGRRRRHEREAAVMNQRQRDDDAAPKWETVGPMLDDVVAKLKREDRDALALRYFQGRSVADVAVAMGVSQDAAQKRLSRAVDRLRELFARRGVHTSADAISSVLMANALIVAPAALGTSIAGTALTGAAAATATGAGAASGTTKGALTIMAIAKTKLAVASVAAVMLVGVTGTIAYQTLHTPGGKGRQVRLNPAATQASVAAAATPFTIDTPADLAARARFDQRYMLAPGETIKRVPRPFIPERLTFYRMTAGRAQVEAMPEGPDAMLIYHGAKGLTSWGIMFGGAGHDVRDLLRAAVGISPEETDLPREVLSRVLPGDWVMREGAPVADRMAALTQALSQEMGRTYRSEVRQLEREVIVVRGTYAYHPLPNVIQERRGGGGGGSGETIHFYIGQPQKQPTGMNGSGGAFAGIFGHLGLLAARQIIVETTLPSRGPGSYKAHASMQPFYRKDMDPAALDELLANVAKQTSLQFRRERRVVPTWVFTTP